MSGKKEKFRRLFLLMLLLYWLIPLAFILMTFADFNVSGFRRIAAYAVGALFWTGAVSGTAVLAFINRIRKSDSENGEIRGMVGAFSFFRTKQGRLVDKIMIAAVVTALVFTFIGAVPQTVKFILWAAAIFLIILHSAVNGRNYIYMNNHMKG